MRKDKSLPTLSFHSNNNDESFFEMLTQIKPVSRNHLKINPESRTITSSFYKKIFPQPKINPFEQEKTELECFKKNPKIINKLYGKDYSYLLEKIKDELDNNSTIKIRKRKEYFSKTKYSSLNSVKDFYSKYRKFKLINNKEPIKKFTPSLAFINTCNKEMIIPNPLGLVKRKGDINILNMNNQHVGNRYIKALSSGLEYSDHINSFQLSSNNLNESGTVDLFNSLHVNPTLFENLIKLNLSNNRIGNLGSEELVNFLNNDRCMIEDLNIENNNLKDNNIINITKAIYENKFLRIRKLNLGNNEITDNSSKSIANLINEKKTLVILILRLNNLCNSGATLIMNKIKYLPNLKILDLSWNKIGNDLIKEPLFEEIVTSFPNNAFRKFPNYELNKCYSTMKLEFKKNPYSIIDKRKPLINLKKQNNKNNNSIPKKIKVKIPERQPSSFSKELSSYISMKNNPLIHLDISNNNLPYEDCELISKEYKNNHTILGTHIDGNEMIIDSLGFITAIKKEKNLKSSLSKSHLFIKIDSDKNLTKTNIDNVRKIRSINKCWICENWREIEFFFYPKEPIIDPQYHLVKIHLSIDDWKPYDMIGNGTKYTIVRMCPPGHIYYFFSVDGIPIDNYNYSLDNSNYINSNNNNKNYSINNENCDNFVDCQKHPIRFYFDDNFYNELNNIKLRERYNRKSIILNNNNSINNSPIKDNKKEDINLENNSLLESSESDSNNDESNIFKKENIVHFIGKKLVKENLKVINEDYINTLKYCVPRPERIFNKFIKPRAPWTFPTSIWYHYGYNYEGENDDYINKCFEHDFKRCQFEKDFKKETDLLDLKSLLRKNYRNIIDCYKTLSSYSGLSIWQISQSTLTEWINKCENLVDKKYDINNIFLVETGITASLIDKMERKKNNKNLCDNLVRHQFMSLLVKVPKDKYIRTLKTMNNTLEAVKYSFENHFENAIKGYSHHKWRKERYYNEKVDNFLKAYLPLLDAVYHSWAKQKGPRKKE